MSPAPGYITLVWPTGTLDILLADVSPTITAGYSIFNEITRPKRSTVIEYVGKELFRMDVGGMFDGWIANRSVEQNCNTLELLAISRGGKGNPPQDFRVDGPVPHRSLQWYLEALEWGDAIYDGPIRLRQAFVMKLVQKLDMPYVLKNSRERPRAVGGGYRTIVSRSGDLRELAQVMLGDSFLWRRMTDTKGKKFRDWRVKKNTKVRVPR